MTSSRSHYWTRAWETDVRILLMSHDTVPLIISLQIEASLDAVEKMLSDLSRSHYWTRARETAPSLIAAYSDKEKFMQVISVVDSHHLDADPDADLDPTFHSDADPDPSLRKRLKPWKKW
jgi:hypothetical protein